MDPASPSTDNLDSKLITAKPLKDDVPKLPDLKKYELTTLRTHPEETKPQPKPEPEPEPEPKESPGFSPWSDIGEDPYLGESYPGENP